MKSGMIIWGTGSKRLIAKFLSYQLSFMSIMRIQTIPKAIVEEWEKVK